MVPRTMATTINHSNNNNNNNINNNIKSPHHMTRRLLEMVQLKLFLSVWLLFVGVVAVGVAADDHNNINLNCNPCIYRPEYKLRGIFHGSYKSPFWQQVAATAIQSANDLNIPINITMYDEYNPEQMVQDLLEIVQDLESSSSTTTTTRPDALLVTIPTVEVQDVVRQIVQGGIPVFGLNSGYKEGQDAGVLAWVAQDEYIAGQQAAMEFLQKWQEVSSSSSQPPNEDDNNNTTSTRKLQQQSRVFSKVVFVNHEQGNSGLEDRRQGFTDTILDVTGIVVQELIIDDEEGGSSSSTYSLVANCSQWDLILFASARTMNIALGDENGTLLLDQCGNFNLLGTFDENQFVYEGIRQDKIVFGVSQQKYLQGMLPVLFATLYVTTGKIPATPLEGDYGVYLSGPSVIKKDNLPTKDDQICADDAYPICPNTLVPAALVLGPLVMSTTSTGTTTLDGSSSVSTCPCTERSNLQIAGVLHGVTTDAFWDPVFEAAEMAARDMGVDLDLERLQPRASDEFLHNAMATKIKAVCQRGVDGLFVTIPSDLVIDAIQECLDKGINVISINSGAEVAKALGLVHHIGQLEFNAGFAAGKQILEAGATKVWCLNHEPGTNAVHERCNGVAVAIAEGSIANRNIEYKGEVVVSRDDADEYKANVEAAVNKDGDWDDFGLVLAGQIQAELALGVKAAHSKVLMGSFDTSDALFEAFNEQQILFGIDQQPFLQGYMPIPLLTYLSYTGQRLVNDVIESGPSLVFAPPSLEQQICDDNFYKVCIGEPGPVDSGGSATVSSLSKYWSLLLVPLFASFDVVVSLCCL